MPLLSGVRSVTASLDTVGMLRYLIKDRFPGKTVVTASLRNRSLVVLHMVSQIEPATPVVFCRPGKFFPDSLSFQDEIVARFALTNIGISVGREAKPRENDCSHCERMWVENENSTGRSFELMHLNDTLAPYDCWISAAYHVKRPAHVQQRVDVEGRLIRVDALRRWSNEEVRAYMAKHDIPHHQRAYRKQVRPEVDKVLEALPPFAF